MTTAWSCPTRNSSRSEASRPKEIDEAGIFDVADELVDQRWQHAADALRDHYQAHALAIGHPQCAGGVELPALHALDARAEDLADIGAGDQAECQNAERIGGRPEKLAAQTCEALSDDQDRHDGRKAAEDIRVDPCTRL